MSKFLKVIFVFSVIGLISFAPAQSAFAEEAKAENGVTAFFKRLFNYPVKATQETADVVGTAASNTGEKVIAPTAENVGAIVTGDVAKTGDLIAEPIVGVAETTGQAVAETVQIPANVAQEEQTTVPAEAQPAV